MADNTLLTQALLDSMNVEQGRDENRAALDAIGGQEKFLRLVGVNPDTGLTSAQVTVQREKFGDNCFPESPMDSYLELLIGALSDTTLLILTAAAAVSLIIGSITEPEHGWIEGAAIFIAIFLVSNISAGNDYTKQLQFRALEASSAKDERTSVLRNGTIERINPVELVVGDILVLQVRLYSVCSAISTAHHIYFRDIFILRLEIPFQPTPSSSARRRPSPTNLPSPASRTISKRPRLVTASSCLPVC
jgi:magnesium-transporting ATPase (P-type)